MAHSCSIDVCIKGPADCVKKVANQINAKGGLRCDYLCQLATAKKGDNPVKIMFFNIFSLFSPAKKDK